MLTRINNLYKQQLFSKKIIMEYEIFVEKKGSETRKICNHRGFKITYSSTSIFVQKLEHNASTTIHYKSAQDFKSHEGLFHKATKLVADTDYESYRFVEKLAEEETLNKVGITRKTLEDIVEKLAKFTS